MEEIFKQNLLRLRQPLRPTTFSEALFSDALWSPRKSKRTAPRPAELGFSEKTQVLDSFQRFAHEKLEEEKAPVFKIEGGEIAVKADPTWDGIRSYDHIYDLRLDLSLPPEVLDILLAKNPGQVKAIFVTETFRPWSEVGPELKGGFIDQLIAGFPVKTAELFERMILAMKFLPEEVLLYPVESEGKDVATEVMTLALHFKPEIIITLGAKATQKILKSNDRLSLIHGQFFKRSIDGTHSFQVVPLFHPSIIETNQNMKKTAWADMQKIMKHLKKLP